MKILIIGGHGFIGAHTTKILCELGHECTVVDNHDHYGNYPLAQYEFVVGQRVTYLAQSRYTFIMSDMSKIDWGCEYCIWGVKFFCSVEYEATAGLLIGFPYGICTVGYCLFY